MYHFKFKNEEDYDEKINCYSYYVYFGYVKFNNIISFTKRRSNQPRFDLKEYVLLKIGEKTVEYALDYIINTGYSKIVVKNGVKYCVVYSGNPWGASEGSYRVYS